MVSIEERTSVDWSACELVEQVPGKVSGRVIIKDTRIFPEAIANSFELGDTVEEIHEGFPSVSIPQIRRLIDFAREQEKQQPS